MIDLPGFAMRKALELGADDASVIGASQVVVDQRFADMCSSGDCPGYGLSPTCPPLSMKPSEFRELLDRYGYALVFRVDVPLDMLLGEGRHQAARSIHLISSALEDALRGAGVAAEGFATGSCKLCFCDEYPDCPVVDGTGECRFHGEPRPSLSGLGVNFSRLFDSLGWTLEVIADGGSSGETGSLAGMVLFQEKGRT